MILHVRNSFSKRDVSGRSSSGTRASSRRWTSLFGKRNSPPAHTPSLPASSSESQRSIPLLRTRNVSFSKGPGGSAAILRASISASLSSIFDWWMKRLIVAAPCIPFFRRRSSGRSGKRLISSHYNEMPGMINSRSSGIYKDQYNYVIFRRLPFGRAQPLSNR